MNKKGVILLVVIFLVVLTLGAWMSTFNQQKSSQIVNNNINNQEESYQEPSQNQENYNPETKGCTGTGTVKFTVSPRNIEDIGFIEPMGIMIGMGILRSMRKPCRRC